MKTDDLIPDEFFKQFKTELANFTHRNRRDKNYLYPMKREKYTIKSLKKMLSS